MSDHSSNPTVARPEACGSSPTVAYCEWGKQRASILTGRRTAGPADMLLERGVDLERLARRARRGGARRRGTAGSPVLLSLYPG